MLQRIQSVYLLIAGILLLLVYFFPLATYLTDVAYLKLFITHLKSFTPGLDAPIQNSFILPLAIFNGIIAIISFVSIFVYKKRMLQSRMVKLCVLMSTLMLALIFFLYSPQIAKATAAEADFATGYGLYFILGAIVMLILANRGIIKDEKLVRSADRLR